jgi:hypothetical protein
MSNCGVSLITASIHVSEHREWKVMSLDNPILQAVLLIVDKAALRRS